VDNFDPNHLAVKNYFLDGQKCVVFNKEGNGIPACKPELKSKIKSTVVKEFEGVELLPDNW